MSLEFGEATGVVCQNLTNIHALSTKKRRDFWHFYGRKDVSCRHRDRVSIDLIYVMGTDSDMAYLGSSLHKFHRFALPTMLPQKSLALNALSIMPHY